MKHARTLLIACAVVFFAVTVWYGRPAGLWNSPDETANAFWAARVAQGAPLIVSDTIVGLGAGAIHPRSMAVVGDALVPGSFTGLILLYGTLQMLFKIPFFLLTPLFTVVAGAFFGVLVGRLFDRRVGFLAAILFFLHPAILYYSARGLFHNVLLIDLLILSAACFVLRKDRIGDAFGGFLFGWAMCVRTSEALWAIPAFLTFLPFIGKERWRRLGWAFVGAALPLFFILQTNANLYGSPFKTAYVAVAAPAAVSERIPASDVSAPVVASTPALSLPFGFNAKRVLRNAWSYGIAVFWWQSLLAVFGLIWWCATFRTATKIQKIYAATTFLVAAWLAVLYGSWAIRDRLDPGSVTIGTSYVRYFLPAYVAMLPFGALALARFGEKLKREQVSMIAILLIGILTMRTVVFAGDESLRDVRATLAGNAAKRTWLLREALPSNAVVMTDRFDKLIVPEILRIIPTADEAGFAAAAAAVHHAPVYWYGLPLSEEELLKLEALAERQGLAFVALENPVSGESLYALELL